jgi:hypothetical protein
VLNFDPTNPTKIIAKWQSYFPLGIGF